MRRNLTLKSETLTELTPGELVAVAAAGQPSEVVCEIVRTTLTWVTENFCQSYNCAP